MNIDFQVSEVLIISASERGFDLRDAVQEALKVQVSVKTKLQDAACTSGSSPFRIIVLDEALADLAPAAADSFLSRCNDAFPIFLNLAIVGVQRCVQLIQLGIRRFQREQEMVTLEVRRSMNSQMRDALTSLFLHSQLAQETPGLSPETVMHLNAILEAGDALKRTLVG